MEPTVSSFMWCQPILRNIKKFYKLFRMVSPFVFSYLFGVKRNLYIIFGTMQLFPKFQISKKGPLWFLDRKNRFYVKRSSLGI